MKKNNTVTLIITCLEHNKVFWRVVSVHSQLMVMKIRESIMTSVYTLLSVTSYFAKEIKEDFLTEETLKEMLLFLLM